MCLRFLESGYYRNISSFNSNGKYLISDESNDGTIHSTLTIVNVDLSDDSRPFICSAENRAGVKTKNFTVIVLPSSAFGVPANWSKMELAGCVVGLLITLILAFVFITLILIRSKRFSFVGEKKFQQSNTNSLDKKPCKMLKGGNAVYSNSGYPYGASLQQHLSMLGLDGIDKKPEIFLNTNIKDDMTNQPPDLVSASKGHLGNGNTGYELDTYCNNGNDQCIWLNKISLTLNI